jgi:hypothetical protein
MNKHIMLLFCVISGLFGFTSAEATESIIKIPVNVVSFSSTSNGFWKSKNATVTQQTSRALIDKINSVAGFKLCKVEFYLASYQVLLKLDPSEASSFSTWTLEGQALKKVMPKKSGLYLMLGAFHTKNIEVAGELAGVNTGIVSSMIWPNTTTAAHELGHALGLKHEEGNYNLMQSRSSPFKSFLSYEQCEKIRRSWTRR